MFTKDEEGEVKEKEVLKHQNFSGAMQDKNEDQKNSIAN